MMYTLLVDCGHDAGPYLGGFEWFDRTPLFGSNPPFLIEFPVENVEFTTSRWNSNPPFSIERTPVVLKTSNRLPRIDYLESKNSADYPPRIEKTSPSTPPRIEKTSPTTPPLELRKLRRLPPLELRKLRRLPPLSNFQVKKTNPPLDLWTNLYTGLSDVASSANCGHDVYTLLVDAAITYIAIAICLHGVIRMRRKRDSMLM